MPWHVNGHVHGRKLSRASNHPVDLPQRPFLELLPVRISFVTQVVHFAYDAETVAGGRAVVSRASKKEFRTSVILTETQFKQVRELAREHDVSIAWVLRQAVDRYLATQGSERRDAVQQPPGASE